MKLVVMTVVMVAVVLGACRREAPVEMLDDAVEHIIVK